MTALTDDDELLAAELAFGLLDAPEHEATTARAGADPAFAAAVSRWQAHAIAMLGARDEAPSPHVWRAIAARLPANDNVRATLRRWQAATVAASLAAVLLGVVALRDRPLPAPEVQTVPVRATAPLVAMLRGEDAGVVAVAYDRAGGRLTVTPNELALADARAAELWVIPAGGKPVSLGVIAASAASSRAAPRPSAQIVPGATLAVSVEPAGGSPTGQPTGPVILSGTVSES